MLADVCMVMPSRVRVSGVLGGWLLLLHRLRLRHRFFFEGALCSPLRYAY